MDHFGPNRLLRHLLSVAPRWGPGAHISPSGTRKRRGLWILFFVSGKSLQPRVLPELLLLGSLPRWGETGTSQRCPERYGRRGGDGSCARHERLGGPRGGTALSPSPLPRPGSGDESRLPGHRAPQEPVGWSSPGLSALAPCRRSSGTEELRSIACGSRGSRRAAKRTSQAVGTLLAAPRPLRENCFTA